MPDADRRSDDGDNDDDEDDEDDIFQDPAVERERRRKHSRRRQKKKRRLQRQPPPPPLQQLGSVVGSPADVGGEDGGGCCTTSIRSGYGEKPCDDPAEAVCSGSAATAMDAPPIKDSRGRARDCQVDEDIDSLGKGGRRPTAGSAAASASVASTTTAAATAAAASTVAAISGAAACGGLAELSLVPGILKDESVGAVVAAAGERGEADQGGAGVPEMSIAGRRLNKEVRAFFVIAQQGTEWFQGRAVSAAKGRDRGHLQTRQTVGEREEQFPVLSERVAVRFSVVYDGQTWFYESVEG